MSSTKAVKTKSTFKMDYAITVNVKATPTRLWAMLTNAQDFPRWNSTLISVEGRIAAGEKIKLKAKSAPDRVFDLAISEFVPEKRMVWRDGNAPMFTGVRTFMLAPQANGTTDFYMQEEYAGLMLPMIAGSLPDFAPVFEQYAADLKREAEGA